MTVDTYQLFQNGTELLEKGDYHQATVPLRAARDADPGKSSIREALGRALFMTQHYEEAAGEFRAVVEQAPTNDYALFCLGRSPAAARPPPRLAPAARPGLRAAAERRDYRRYRDRARAACER